MAPPQTPSLPDLPDLGPPHPVPQIDPELPSKLRDIKAESGAVDPNGQCLAAHVAAINELIKYAYWAMKIADNGIELRLPPNDLAALKLDEYVLDDSLKGPLNQLDTGIRDAGITAQGFTAQTVNDFGPKLLEGVLATIIGDREFQTSFHKEMYRLLDIAKTYDTNMRVDLSDIKTRLNYYIDHKKLQDIPIPNLNYNVEKTLAKMSGVVTGRVQAVNAPRGAFRLTGCGYASWKCVAVR